MADFMYTDVKAERINDIYSALLDTLVALKSGRSEAVAGMAAILAQQYTDKVVEAEELAQFTKDLSDWIAIYFVKPVGGVN
jgi:hypothetical protein